MYRQFIPSLISMILLGCAHPHIELAALRSKIDMLEGQLQEERTRNTELTAELKAVRPPAANQGIPIREVVAMSDQYIDKNVSIEGRLVAEAFFKNGMGYFVIQGSDNNYVVQCYFKNDSLDATSRRILVSKSPLQPIQVSGRLVKSVNGLAKEIGIYPNSGYEFRVEKILK